MTNKLFIEKVMKLIWKFENYENHENYENFCENFCISLELFEATARTRVTISYLPARQINWSVFWIQEEWEDNWYLWRNM